MTTLFDPDPERWRALQEPHESIDAVNAASKAFLDAVSELRVQHRIADLLIVMHVRVKTDDGERDAMLPQFYGDFLRHEGMAAYAYGEAASSRQQYLSDILNGKAITRKGK